MSIQITQLISNPSSVGFAGSLTEGVFTVLSMEVAQFFKEPTGWGISEQILNKDYVKQVAIRTPTGRIIAEVDDFKGSGIQAVEVNGVKFLILPIEAWQYQRKLPKN